MADIVQGIPALSPQDPVAVVAQYTRDLRSYLILHMPMIQTGSIDVALAGNSTAYSDVTFPEPFDSVPTVVVWNNHSNTAPRVVPHVWGLTTTGCRVGLYTTDGTTHGGTRAVGWMAVVTP